MAKFNKGDRVRVKAGSGTYEGDIYVVNKYHKNGNVLIKGSYSDGVRPSGGLLEWNLELVEPAEKRDYVADHARRTLRAAGLTKEQARAAVQAMQDQPSNDKAYQLSSLSRKLPQPLDLFLSNAFVWSDTPQGWNYWNEIVSKRGTHAQA